MDSDTSWYGRGHHNFYNIPSTSGAQSGRPPDNNPRIEEPDTKDIIETVCLVDHEVDPEEAVDNFHNTTRRNILLPFTGVEIQNELRFLEAIKQFKMILEEKVEVLTQRKNLRKLLYKYLIFFSTNYARIGILYKEQYLDVMEDILVFYCDVIREYFRDQRNEKQKVKVVQEARRIKILFRDCLLKRMDRILQVLLKVRLAPELDQYRLMWGELYIYFLTKVPYKRSDDDILRGFIAFQKLKTIRARTEAPMIDKLMCEVYKKTTSELSAIPCLAEIMDKMKNDRRYTVRDMVVRYMRYYKEKRSFNDCSELDDVEEVPDDFLNDYPLSDFTDSLQGSTSGTTSSSSRLTERRRRGVRRSSFDLDDDLNEYSSLLSQCNNSFSLFDEDITKQEPRQEPVEEPVVILDDEDDDDDDDVILVSDNLKTVITIDDDEDEPLLVQPPKTPPPREVLSPDKLVRPPEETPPPIPSQPIEESSPNMVVLPESDKGLPPITLQPMEEPPLNRVAPSESDNKSPLKRVVLSEFKKDSPLNITVPPNTTQPMEESPLNRMVPPDSDTETPLNRVVLTESDKESPLNRLVLPESDTELPLNSTVPPELDSEPTQSSSTFTSAQPMELTTSDSSTSEQEHMVPEKPTPPKEILNVNNPQEESRNPLVELEVEKQLPSEEKVEVVPLKFPGLDENMVDSSTNREQPKFDLVENENSSPSEKVMEEQRLLPPGSADVPEETKEIVPTEEQIKSTELLPNPESAGQLESLSVESGSQETTEQLFGNVSSKLSSESESLMETDSFTASATPEKPECVVNSTMNEEIVGMMKKTSISPIARENVARSRHRSVSLVMGPPHGVLPSSKIPSEIEETSPVKMTVEEVIETSMSPPSYEKIDRTEAGLYFKNHIRKSRKLLSTSESGTSTTTSSSITTNTSTSMEVTSSSTTSKGTTSSTSTSIGNTSSTSTSNDTTSSASTSNVNDYPTSTSNGNILPTPTSIENTSPIPISISNSTSTTTSFGNTPSTPASIDDSEFHVTADSLLEIAIPEDYHSKISHCDSDVSSGDESEGNLHEDTVIQVNRSTLSLKTQIVAQSAGFPDKSSDGILGSSPNALIKEAVVEPSSGSALSKEPSNYSNLTECFTRFADELSVEDICISSKTSFSQEGSMDNNKDTFEDKQCHMEPQKDEENTGSEPDAVGFSTDEVPNASNGPIALLVTYPGSSQEETQHFLMCDANLAFSEEQLASSSDELAHLSDDIASSNSDCSTKANADNKIILPFRRETIDSSLSLSGSQPYTPQSSPSTRIETVRTDINGFEEASNVIYPCLNEASTAQHQNKASPYQQTAILANGVYKTSETLEKVSKLISKTSKRRKSAEKDPKPQKKPTANKTDQRNCDTTTLTFPEHNVEDFREDLSQSLTSAKRVTPQEVDKISQLPFKYSQQLWGDITHPNTEIPRADLFDTHFPEKTISSPQKTLAQPSISQASPKNSVGAPVSTLIRSAGFAEKKYNEIDSKVYGNDLSRPDSRLSQPDSLVSRPDSRLSQPDSLLAQPDSRIPRPDSRLAQARSLKSLKISAKDKHTKDYSQPKDRDISLKAYKSLIKGVSRLNSASLNEVSLSQQKSTFDHSLFDMGMEGPIGKPLGPSEHGTNFFWDSDSDAARTEEEGSGGTISVKPDAQLYQSKKEGAAVGNLVSALKSSKPKIGGLPGQKSLEKKKVAFPTLTVELDRFDLESRQRKISLYNEMKRRQQRQESLAIEMKERQEQSLQKDEILFQINSKKVRPTASSFRPTASSFRPTASSFRPTASSTSWSRKGKTVSFNEARHYFQGKDRDRDHVTYRNGHRTAEKRKNRDFDQEAEAPRKKVAHKSESMKKNLKISAPNGKIETLKIKSIMKPVEPRSSQKKATERNDTEATPRSPVKKTKSGRVSKKPRPDYDDLIRRSCDPAKARKAVKHDL